jgi:signal transduction histidine kinase
VDLSSELVSSLDPTEIANSFVRRVVATVNADRCTLFRVEPDGLVIEASHDRTGTEGWLGTRYPIEHVLTQPELRQALEGREAVLGGPLPLDQVSSGHGALVEDVEHTATLPLVVGEKPDGLLVLSRVSGPAFTADDVEMLRLIGHVAALALRNARLFAGAQEASQAKSLFLNMAAHELRTPLTVILGYVSLLLEGSLGPPSDSWRPALELLEGKSRELAALVDGILIAARLEEGPIGLPREMLDLRDVLARAVVRLQPRARLTQAEVVAEAPPSELLVEAHQESLDQILDNLLNNAIAYSASGPRVRLRARSEDGQAVVAVDDLGVGIAADMRERIFERLVRIDQPQLGFPPGTGLGLYISRTLAERMNGSLVLAHSEPGQGSTFELRLPLAGGSRKGRGRGGRRALTKG